MLYGGKLMTPTEAIEYIHSRLTFGIHPGMERIEALCAALGNPQDELRFIHVAGTNGKGSSVPGYVRHKADGLLPSCRLNLFCKSLYFLLSVW